MFLGSAEKPLEIFSDILENFLLVLHRSILTWSKFTAERRHSLEFMTIKLPFFAERISRLVAMFERTTPFSEKFLKTGIFLVLSFFGLGVVESLVLIWGFDFDEGVGFGVGFFFSHSFCRNQSRDRLSICSEFR
jgi:hypothetical protein